MTQWLREVFILCILDGKKKKYIERTKEIKTLPSTFCPEYISGFFNELEYFDF